MFIIRKRLAEREGAPPDTRYDEDTDTVETSTDGGVTWNPNPGADPRINPAYLRPPNTEEDVRCAAAGGAVDYVQDVVNAGIDGATLAGIANVLFAGVLLFLPVSWLFAIFIVVGEGLLAIGSAALSFSFTEGVYEQLLCIFFDNMDEDGRLDEAALSDVQADIAAIIDDVTVETVFDLIVRMTGHVGFSNTAALHADGGADCGACPEDHCLEVDLTLTDGSEYGVALSPGGGTWQAGLGYESVDFASGQDVTVVFVFPDALTCTAVEAQYSKTTAGGSFDVNNLRSLNPFVNYASDQVDIDPTNDLGEHLVKAIIYPLGQILEGCSIDVNTGTTGGATKAYVERFIIRYTSPIPEGWIDNCPE